ncbi:hypothetical protein [Nonomuraea sp. NPDC048826]|uniref:hypothetical protein n=1 Tax=Nonomuraea sp. NPDC048826 TaxID=3364347 RepID=UPI0037236C5E
MAMIRLVAVGFLCGVLFVPFAWPRQETGFEHARLDALTALVLGQFSSVLTALVIGFVVIMKRSRTRTPGYVLGAVTIAFGLIVLVQGVHASNWVDTRPAVLGDREVQELVILMVWGSGAVTMLTGLLIVLLRWAGYDARATPVRRRGPRGSGRTRRRRVRPVVRSAPPRPTGPASSPEGAAAQ